MVHAITRCQVPGRQVSSNLHPALDRLKTVAEAKRFQSMPDDMRLAVGALSWLILMTTMPCVLTFQLLQSVARDPWASPGLAARKLKPIRPLRHCTSAAGAAAAGAAEPCG